MLDGRDVLAIMPTGSGDRSLPLPALISEGLTVVISPLIALIQDEYQALRAGGFEGVECWRRHRRAGESPRAGARYGEGGARLLYVAADSFRAVGFWRRSPRWVSPARGRRGALPVEVGSRFSARLPPSPTCATDRFALHDRADRDGDAAVARDMVAALGLRDAETTAHRVRRPNLFFEVIGSGRSWQGEGTCRAPAGPRAAAGGGLLRQAQEPAWSSARSRSGNAAGPYHAGLAQSVARRRASRFWVDRGGGGRSDRPRFTWGSTRPTWGR